MPGPKLFCCLSIAIACAGCAAAPVVQNRQDTAEHLVAGARTQVSPRPPSYSLNADQVDAMPQGSRCVIETTDADPVRVITATVLKVDATHVLLRTGVVRTLSRDWERRGDGEPNQPHNRGPADQLAVQETPFENQRLPLAEIHRVDVYLNAAQASWQRQDEGWRPAGRAAASKDDDRMQNER